MEKESIPDVLSVPLGFALLLAGIAWDLIRAGVAAPHVASALVILIGVIIGVSRTRTKDPS